MTGKFDYFVVFAEMRTGSNFLEANLNALDGVSCLGEAFNPHFIGYPKQSDILGVTQDMRDNAPDTLLTAVRKNRSGLAGFRYFHDHDPRVLEPVLDDPRCAKIILTRNPAESYVSWKIAMATGQWKLTDAKSRKDGKARFDSDEFDTHVTALQEFQVRLMRHLQKTGQTAFYLDYEDLQDVDVMNGLASFLGVDARLEGLDKTLKKQNPATLADKVANFEDMEVALSGIDRFNLTRTPNFEPRRGPAVPSFVAAADAPLMYLPVKGGPQDRVEDWLAALDGVGRENLIRKMSQKDVRQWKRARAGHRTFTVLRHPLERAHHAFCTYILATGPGSYDKIRKTLIRRYQVPLPDGEPDGSWDKTRHRDAFSAFLSFLKGNLSGQTAIRVDAAWCSQIQAVQGFAEFVVPDVVLRESGLEAELVKLAADVGCEGPELAPARSDHPIALSDIYDKEIESLCHTAYQRDYMMFGFSDWMPDQAALMD